MLCEFSLGFPRTEVVYGLSVARHILMGIELSMPSILGFVSLARIVVNDSILLVLIPLATSDRRLGRP